MTDKPRRLEDAARNVLWYLQSKARKEPEEQEVTMVLSEALTAEAELREATELLLESARDQVAGWLEDPPDRDAVSALIMRLFTDCLDEYKRLGL